MNFIDQLEEENILYDLFNEKEDFHQIEKHSDGSIFDDMVDAIMKEEKPVNGSEIQEISQKHELIDQNEHLSIHNSIDHCLLFDMPHGEEVEEELANRDNSKATQASAKVAPEEKIFKISTCNKKLVDNLKAPNKETAKDEIKMEEDNKTEIDPNEQIEELPVPKQSKRPRRDVTYKTILRKCRKYYQTKFNEETGYLKSKKKEPCSFYKACILKFLENKFEFETHLNVSFHLGCLLYPQEMIRGIESFVYPDGVKTFTPKKVVKRKIETHKQQVDTLHSILYKFTHEKLDKFISVPELAVIFLNFIQNGAGDDVNSAEFIEEYEDLSKRCNKTLSKCKKVKGVATLFE